MAKEIRTILHRSRETILADVLGVTALVVMLVASLSLPTLI